MVTVVIVVFPLVCRVGVNTHCSDSSVPFGV